ncbi:MAG: DUF192 domain-containing protein [Candidatus Methylacidiphilales bacterium]
MRADVCLLTHCAYSDSLFFRIKGLLGRKELQSDEGIWLKPCQQIHMFFMNFPIDVIFLDQKNKVVHLCHHIRPWYVSPLVWSARSVIECRAGLCEKWGLKTGDLLSLES